MLASAVKGLEVTKGRAAGVSLKREEAAEEAEAKGEGVVTGVSPAIAA